MSTRLASALAALTVASIAGCGPAPADHSSSTPTLTCGSEEDCHPEAPVCARVAPGSACVPAVDTLSCATDSDCASSAGAFCTAPLTSSAVGLCTRPCDVVSDTNSTCGGGASCDEATVAGMQVCLLRCGVGLACPSGFACGSGVAPAASGLCAPYCTADAQCVGAPCNPYTHRCEALQSDAEDNGAACAVPTDCRSGQCETQGFLDGLCDSPCVQPDAEAYAGPSLPRADCPGDDVCAADPLSGPGMLSRCFPRCGADADCRDDYVCVHPQTPGPGPRTFDGFCDARSDRLASE